jgi:hypothetical protein
MGTGDRFPGGKARPGRDADHSSPSSAEVKNGQELYLLSPHEPPWRVAGQLYLFYLFRVYIFLTCSIIPPLSILFPLVRVWSFSFKLPAVVSQHNRILLPLVAFLYGRNILAITFTLLVADVSKICWKKSKWECIFSDILHPIIL